MGLAANLIKLSQQALGEVARYSDQQLQGMSVSQLVDLIRSKAVTYKQVDIALEKVKALAKLDRIGDLLAKSDLEDEGVHVGNPGN